MKFDFKSLIPKWIAAGTPDTMEVDEAEAVAPETQEAAVARLRAENAISTGPSARERELEDEVARLRVQAVQSQASEATAWFAAQVEAGRLVPADKESVLAVYSALASDHRHGSLDVLATYKASVESRPKNGLTSESIPTDADGAKEFLEAGGFKVLPNAAATPDEAEAKESAARVKAMLAATDAGRDLV